MRQILLSAVIILFIIIASSCRKADDNKDYTVGQYGWAVGSSAGNYGTIFYTTNGGNSWVRQGEQNSIPDCDLADVRAIDKNIIWIAGGIADNYGVILKSENGGKDWVRLGDGQSLPKLELIGINPVSEKVCWIAGDSGCILKTSDGGKTWIDQSDPMYKKYSLQMITAADEQNVWAAGLGDTLPLIIYSSDGGNTWTRQGLDSLQGGNAPNAIIDIYALDDNIVWAVGPGTVVYTLDGGNTWANKPTPAGLMHNNGVCPINDHSAWVATDYNQIYKLNNLDSAWVKQQASEPVPTGEYMGITCFDDNTAWITSSFIGNQGFILHTKDGGKSWYLQDIPYDASLRRISFAGAIR